MSNRFLLFLSLWCYVSSSETKLALLLFPLVFRMIIQRCGFMGLVPEQFLLFQAHITASRGRISSQVGIGKVSSHHSISVTRITIIPKLVVCQWNISNKTRGMQHPLVPLKANHQSSLNRYGKTATNPSLESSHLLVFQGLVVSVKVANHRHSAGLIIWWVFFINWSEETLTGYCPVPRGCILPFFFSSSMSGFV